MSITIKNPTNFSVRFERPDFTTPFSPYRLTYTPEKPEAIVNFQPGSSMLKEFNGLEEGSVMPEMTIEGPEHSYWGDYPEWVWWEPRPENEWCYRLLGIGKEIVERNFYKIPHPIFESISKEGMVSIRIVGEVEHESYQSYSGDFA